MGEAILWAAAGTGFTFSMTTLGAALVFFLGKEIKDTIQKLFLGFAAGVMMAASVWSLLIPAVDQAREKGGSGWIEASGGFFIGILFLLWTEKMLASWSKRTPRQEGDAASWRQTTLLVFVVTLHNIPEGMAVGLACAMAAGQHVDPTFFASAAALAMGIGIQNIPEGAAVALPLRQQGKSAWRAFLGGSFSGLVEPVFGILVVIIAGAVQPIMPWMLAFAAGAMMFVVAEELVPQAVQCRFPYAGTLSIMSGFLLMMVLDVALG